MIKRLTLLQPDIDSLTWRKVRAHLEQRLVYYRARLERITLEHEDSLVLRARIDELKILLTLDQPAPAPVVDES